MKIFDNRAFRHFNYMLIVQILPILFISSFLIRELSASLFHKQMLYYGFSALVFVVAFFIPWRLILWWFAPLFYVVNITLLLGVKYIGKSVLGATRWIELPFLHITIQPSELSKVSIMLMLAYMIYKKPPPKSGYGVFDFLKLLLVIVLPASLIFLEPDLGTALVLVIVGMGILFLSGVDKKIWATILVLVALFAWPTWTYLLKPYQKKRIEDALSHPSYQVKQALIAIGNGGMNGKSKDEATQTQLKFLPVSSTDFIFAYVGERLGFRGMMIVISLYILLIFNLLYISAKNIYDRYISVFASGLAFLFFIYMGVNVFMIIGLAPVVGLPLPMFSHGGTSFVIFAGLLGILEHLISFKELTRYTSDEKVSPQP